MRSDGNSRQIVGSDVLPIARRRSPFRIATRLRGADQRRITFPLVTLVVIAIVWEVGATAADSLLIPTFTETVAALGRLLVSPRLWRALSISNQALVVGFVIAVAIGIPLGLALGRYRGLDRVTNPYLTILLTVPMAGLIPLLVMSVGIGFEARVLIVNARTGVREADPSLIDMARSFGASEVLIWRNVLLPGSVPAVMAGIRLGLGHAVTGMVIVELLLVAAGIGALILEFQAFFDAASVYATIVIVVAEALLLISAANAFARWVTPWARVGSR
jgi:NitT/TauT family transport system permease protein